MKKRNLLVGALMAGVIGAGLYQTSLTAEAKTGYEADDASQVAYGKLNDEQKALVSQSFNADYYAAQYPEIAAKYGKDNKEALLNHFLEFGLWEGRVGNADFDPTAYASAYSDLRDAFGKNILAYYEHYYKIGKDESRPITTLEDIYRNNALDKEPDIVIIPFFEKSKLIDKDIFKAARYSGNVGGSGNAAAPSNAFVAPIAEIPSTDAAVVQTTTGETAVIVDANNQQAVDVLQKCKDMKYIGQMERYNESTNTYDSYNFYVAKAGSGVDLYLSTFNWSETAEPQPQIIDSTYAKNEDGTIDSSKVSGSYDEISLIELFADYSDKHEPEVSLSTNTRNEYNIINKWIDSTSPVSENLETQYDSGYSSFTDSSTDDKANVNTEYAVTYDFKQNADGTVDFSVGAYNEEEGFAIAAGYTFEAPN
ncbi:MAG: hypothetical protein K5769_08875 [Pseudobutyrivibrio sp.]|nr:hypothetical protein [Pseudobutyrivibrio sp.]